MITNRFNTHEGKVNLRFEHPLSEDAVVERQRRRYIKELKMVSDVSTVQKSTTHPEPTTKYKLFGNNRFNNYGKHELIACVNDATINEEERTGWNLRIDNFYDFDKHAFVYVNVYDCV